ncbi:NAD(P)-binding protein [uncultured Brachyspira sp.]|nr:NAD(P)-binding protein [uncultured Brachyspira sp.]
MNKIIILGSGLAGISAGYKLKQKDINFEIFEKKMNMEVFAENYK